MAAQPISGAVNYQSIDQTSPDVSQRLFRKGLSGRGSRGSKWFTDLPGFRSNHQLRRCLPLRSIRHAPGAAIGKGLMSFETDS